MSHHTTNTRPYIICHMISSVDGKIKSSAFAGISNGGDYEACAAKLRGDAWVCGRATMQYFAQRKPDAPGNSTAAVPAAPAKPAGPQPTHVARRAKSHAIAVDTRGALRWRGGDLDGEHLICVVSEQVSAAYLAELRAKKISYIVAGRSAVNLRRAVAQLREHFGIRRLLLEGGGHINGGFLAAGLVDELSLLLVPAIDGRPGIPSTFDGLPAARAKAAAMQLKSVRRLERGTLWLRYEFPARKMPCRRAPARFNHARPPSSSTRA